MKYLLKNLAILMFFPLFLVSCDNTTNPVINVESFNITLNRGIGSDIKILTEAIDGKYLFNSLIVFEVNIIDENYELSEVYYNDNKLELTNNNQYSFYMLDSDVEIRTITKQKDLSDTYIDSIEEFNAVLPEIFKYSDNIVSQEYQILQTDNYGGVSVDSSQGGTRTRYLNNFYEDQFVQSFSDSETDEISGITQRGIINQNNLDYFYEVTDYLNDDSGDSASYIPYQEENIDLNLNVGFGYSYYRDYLTTLFGMMSNNPSGRLVTNFNEDSFIDDGTLTLSIRFTVEEDNVVSIQLERDDVLTIENGIVIEDEVTSLVSYMDGANYIYQEASYNFIEGELTEFTGTRLDPTEF